MIWQFIKEYKSILFLVVWLSSFILVILAAFNIVMLWPVYILIAILVILGIIPRWRKR